MTRLTPEEYGRLAGCGSRWLQAKPMSIPWVCGYRCRGLWWFRLLGYGLHWKRISEHPLMFSERMKINGWRIGNWFFKPLGRRDWGIINREANKAIPL